MLFGGSMKEYYEIDRDTFHQIFGSDDYNKFLERNSSFCNVHFEKEKYIKNVKQTEDKIITPCTTTREFKNFLMLTWLELYLPRFEIKYQRFQYSDPNLSIVQKIDELLEFYSNCGITNICEIPKKSMRRKI